MNYYQGFEPVTQDQAEVYRATRDARAVVRFRRLRRASPRLSLARLNYWREERAAVRDVVDIARGLERAAWERAVVDAGDDEAAHAALWAGLTAIRNY